MKKLLIASLSILVSNLMYGQNTGIGTTTPRRTFVVKNDSVQVNAVVAELASSNGDINFHLVTTKGDPSNIPGSVVTKVGLIWGDGNTESNSFLRFHRGNTSVGGFLSFSTDTDVERMRIDGAGNVGIGTPAPANKLSVSGKMNVTDSMGIGYGNPASVLHLQSGNISDTARADIILSRYWAGNTDTRASSIFHYNNTSTNSDNLAFAVAGNGGSFTRPNSLSQIKMVVQANGSVGMGTTTPDPSSALDVTSTVKGFLPPRMKANQRNNIAAPVAGLIVYCSNCGVNGGEPEYYNGTAWVNMIGGATLTAPLELGDSYQGGKIAYFFQAGDPGYISGEDHGLIATDADQSAGIQWYNGSNIPTTATATAIGTGNSNTNKIVAAQGTGSYAARLCYDLVQNTYSDWYMPSRDELNKLYLNRAAIGGFSNTDYWSSTEGGISSSAYYQNFATGVQGVSVKYGILNVRAIRTF